MANIVVVSGSVRTIQLPCGEFARRLQRLGHAVTFVSTPDFESAASELGVNFVGTPASRRIDPVEPKPEAGWLDRLRSVRARRQSVTDALNDSSVAQLVAQRDPDLVFVEVELVSHLLAMRARGLPLAALTVFPHTFDDPRVPPLHTTTIPGQGADGTERAISLRWKRYRMGLRLDLLRQSLRSPGDHRRSQFRRLAKKLGVSTKELSFDHWVQPAVLTSIPLVSMTPPAFDFPRPARPDLFDVGSMMLESTGPEEMSPELTELIAHGQQHKRPLIYASFGSFHEGDDSDFMNRLLVAFEGRPDWDLVVGLGGRADADAFECSAPNIHLLPWAPQRKLLESADVAVIHGGYSSVHECIETHVPMLLYPFGIDHPGNAARAVHHGLGILGDRALDSPATVESHIDQLLSKASYRSAVEEMDRLTTRNTDVDLVATMDALLGASISEDTNTTQEQQEA